MTVLEDPALLGGIVVRVGDTLYDGSIRTQLNNIRNLLGEEL
jgi:F-type H+-transporting ATPase subunit delta